MLREMFLYPWDLMDEGTDAVADRLNAMGIRSVSMAAVYHQARMLMPHNPKCRLKIHPGGMCYFPFREADYDVLQPAASPLLSGEGFWAEAAGALADQGIDVTAWTVLMHNSRLASAHPEHALVNAFGDPSPSNLCPSSTEARRYALQTARDLRRAGVAQMDAESLDYAGFLHGDHHEMQAYADTSTLNRLLGLCFCPACLARARARGVDGEALRKQVRAAAEAFLRLAPPPPVDAALLAAYDDMRADSVAELYRDIRQDSGLRVRPILWLADGADPLISGVDVKRMGAESLVACYPGAPERVGEFLERARQLMPDACDVTGGVRLMSPQTIRPEQGPAYERAYAERGIGRVIYYNYGMAPLPMLEALAASAREA